MVTEPLLSGANFDPTKLTWLGTITSETSVCATWKTSPVKTWDDMFKREFSLGGSAVGADPDTFALIMRNVFGAKVKLVTGYPGGNDINLAMERHEVDGRCGWSWTSLKSQKNWLPQINVLVQFNLEKNADLPDVPVALERAANDEQRQVLRLLIAGQYVGRPFFTSPDIPAERKAALRAAFDATMKDPQFLADAAKLDLEISPIAAGPIDAFLADLYRTPKDVVAQGRGGDPEVTSALRGPTLRDGGLRPPPQGEADTCRSLILRSVGDAHASRRMAAREAGCFELF